jgi:hypothetical protein
VSVEGTRVETVDEEKDVGARVVELLDVEDVRGEAVEEEAMVDRLAESLAVEETRAESVDEE